MKRTSAVRPGWILIALAVTLAGTALGQPAKRSQTISIPAPGITPVNISNSPTDSTFDFPGNGSAHLLGVDQSGKAYAVWYEWLEPRRFYFATNASGAWSKPVEIEQLNLSWSAEMGFPVLAVSPEGRVQLMFHDGRPPMIDADIFHLAFENGAWTGTTNVSGIATGSSCYGGVAVNPVDGTTFVVWEENQADVPGEWLLMLRYRTASGQWSNIQRLADSSPLVWGYLPKIAIDAKGTAHMVYGYAHTSTLWYSKNATPTNPSGWTNPIRLKETGLDWSFFSVDCDNAGNAYVVWDDVTTGNAEIFLRRINANGTIGSEVNVSQSAAASSEPALAVNRAGDLLVAWTESGNIFANAFVNGAWSGPGNVTNSPNPCMQPSIAVDPSGGAHLSYASQVGGNWEIMYVAFSAGITVVSPNGAESWLSGTLRDVTWISSGVAGNIKIEYSENGGSSWSVAAASAPNTGIYAWTLPSCVSERCLVRVTSLDGAASDTSDAVFSMGPAPTGLIGLSRTSLVFGAAASGPVTAGQTVVVANAGTGAMSWTAVSDRLWLAVTPASGNGAGTLAVSVNPANLAAGTYTGTITVSSAAAANSPLRIAVTLTVHGPSASSRPFGFFETPLDGSIVASSIPVTGWALDDVEIAAVKIYRTAGPGEASSPPGLVYIGDAVLVEGARPDVEASYSGSPFSYRAGWGYMLLTNFLPGSGNGPVTLVALASDKEGNQTELGRKSILCDNAHAAKPFGTIDTPAQGGTASGAAYVNFGWALTPPPALIPVDGTTLNVYIDGLAVGQPVYNQYRADIAANFPAYLNSGGAVGYRIFDTTSLANGIHTIAWTVADNAGREDGLGSRFFSVFNAAAAGIPAGLLPDASDLAVIPADPAPILVRRGFAKAGRAPLHARAGKPFEIEIRETGRLEIVLDRGSAGAGLMTRGYQLVGGEVRPLPIGSTLDPKRGLWTWQPGPGFLGAYDLVFVAERNGRPVAKTSIRVRIAPF